MNDVYSASPLNLIRQNLMARYNIGGLSLSQCVLYVGWDSTQTAEQTPAGAPVSPAMRWSVALPPTPSVHETSCTTISPPPLLAPAPAAEAARFARVAKAIVRDSPGAPVRSALSALLPLLAAAHMTCSPLMRCALTEMNFRGSPSSATAPPHSSGAVRQRM